MIKLPLAGCAFGKAAEAIIKSGKTAGVSSQEWQESAYEIHEQSDLLFSVFGSLLADSLDREFQKGILFDHGSRTEGF